MPRTPASISGLFLNTNSSNTTRVSVPNIAALQSLTAVTVEGYVDLYNLTGNLQYIFNFISGNTGYYLGINGQGRVSFDIGNGSTTGNPFGGNVTLSTYHHLAGSWDGITARAFLDGTLVASAALSGGNTGNPGFNPNIGNGTNNRSIAGVLSEVSISNVARYTANFTPPTGPLTPDANTIGLYHFSEGTGTIAYDSSSQANNGTLSGSPLPTWSAGKWFLGVNTRTAVSSSPRGQVQNTPCSLGFNGSTTKIDLGTSSVLTSLTDYTCEGWLKPVNIGTGGSIFNMGFNFAGNNGFEFRYSNNLSSSGNKLELFNGNASIGSFNNSLPINGWSHVAVTQIGNQATLYINGQPSGGTQTLAQKVQSGVQHGWIGAETGTAVFAAGAMSNINIYNRGLSAAEIQRRFLGQPISNGLVASYPLTEGSGTTAYDLSGNGNNGTITSGTFSADVPSKTRSLVNGNLVYNGNFEFAPPTNVAQTSRFAWITGTSGGSGSNQLFGWMGYFNSTSGASVMFDNSQAHSGNYSLNLTTTGTSTLAAAGQGSSNGTDASLVSNDPLIPALPNTSYTLSCWCKTSNVGTNGAYIVLLGMIGSLGTAHISSTSAQLTGTNSWTFLTCTLTTASDTRYIVPKIVNSTTGASTAWFDDIVLTPTVTPTRSGAV